MADWTPYTSYSKIAISEIGAVYGVYKLAVLQFDKEHVRVFYVGSGNIKERLLAHLSDSETNAKLKSKLGLACYYSYKEVFGGEQARKQEEQKIIDYHQAQGDAECNEISARA